MGQQKITLFPKSGFPAYRQANGDKFDSRHTPAGFFVSRRFSPTPFCTFERQLLLLFHLGAKLVFSPLRTEASLNGSLLFSRISNSSQHCEALVWASSLAGIDSACMRASVSQCCVRRVCRLQAACPSRGRRVPSRRRSR